MNEFLRQYLDNADDKTRDQVLDWVRETYLFSDVFPREDVVAEVAMTCSPEDVFGVLELARWAENNGFVQADMGL